MIPTRRDFLRLSALAAAAGCTLSFPRNAFAAPTSSLTYGVQLYMVRKEISEGHLTQILAEIHKVGFAQVELFPPVYTHPPAELKQILTDAGLTSVSGHFDYVGFEDKIDYAKKVGLMFMICPMVPEAQWTPGGVRKAATDFNTWGKMVKDAGMTFAFHNHCYEFKPLADGSSAFDVMMSQTDPDLVFCEMDVFWVVQGGIDPVKLLQKYPGRFKAFHIKDMKKGAPIGLYEGHAPASDNVIVGQGMMDWPAIVAQGRKSGVKYWFIEDETSDPVGNIPPSLDFLATLGLKP